MPRTPLLLAALVCLTATPTFAGPSYALMRVGVRGAHARLATDAGAALGTTLQPELGLTVYGGDWFLKVDLGGPLATALDAVGAPAQRPLGPARPLDGRAALAHPLPGAFGQLEVGPHWPVGGGALAVGLRTRGTRLGLHTRDREGPWITGGDGLELGLSVHYAFEVTDGLRLDPSLAAGAGLLWGEARSTGAWAEAEVQAFLQLAPHVSLHVGLGARGLRYAAEAEAALFTGRALTFTTGVALHGLLGLGERDL